MSKDSEKTVKKPKRIPPVEHRFQPGQSGNPGGRPKQEDPATKFAKLMEEWQLQTQQGMKPLGDIILRKLATEAAQGKSHHLTLALSLWQKGFSTSETDESVQGDFEKLTRLIGPEILKKLLGSNGSGSGSTGGSSSTDASHE